jgi:hypothetical protein
MSAELTDTIVAWATEVATHAAGLPSRQAREDYLTERRHELLSGAQAEGATPDEAAVLADTCVTAAREILIELLAQRAGAPQGHA